MDSETVTREFDDEQYKLEDGDEEGDTDMQTMERANEISRQYESIKDRTLGDNLVAGRLEDIDTSPANSNINVLVDLPGEGNNKTFRFKKPKVWSRDYDFVRWIQYYGYDADSFPNMLKGQCDVEVKNIGDEEYELFIPEYNSRREKIKGSIPDLGKRSKDFFEVYRNEDNYVYFGPPLLVLNIIHGMLWATPVIDYGFAGTTSTMLVLIPTILLLVFWFVEDAIIKTESTSDYSHH